MAGSFSPASLIRGSSRFLAGSPSRMSFSICLKFFTLVYIGRFCFCASVCLVALFVFVLAVFMFSSFPPFVVGSIPSIFLRGCCLHKFGFLSFSFFLVFGAGLWGL